MINYKHLHYFWVVAHEGGIARASERLHITPQTISGQISLLEKNLDVHLFTRMGRNLEITDTGRLILSFADEIFSLGSELEQLLHHIPDGRPELFRVGVVDVLQKSIAQQILLPALQMPNLTRMVCKEANLESLLAELAVHHLDLVLADRPIPPNISTRGFSYKLGECAISFFASKRLVAQLSGDFPQCLHGAQILLPARGSQLRTDIDQWLDKNHIHPRVVAEFDDSALMKAFAQQGVGIFIAPTISEQEIMQQYQVQVIGQTDDIQETFYAISVERRISNPMVTAVIEAANKSLFAHNNTEKVL